MAIAALTLGFVGLVTWIFPPLGFFISGIGLILGILGLVLSKQQKGRAIAGIILCSIGLVLNIGVVIGLVAAAVLFEQLGGDFYGF
jgi:hypothetical protein